MLVRLGGVLTHLAEPLFAGLFPDCDLAYICCGTSSMVSDIRYEASPKATRR